MEHIRLLFESYCVQVHTRDQWLFHRLFRERQCISNGSTDQKILKSIQQLKIAPVFCCFTKMCLLDIAPPPTFFLDRPFFKKVCDLH